MAKMLFEFLWKFGSGSFPQGGSPSQLCIQMRRTRTGEQETSEMGGLAMNHQSLAQLKPSRKARSALISGFRPNVPTDEVFLKHGED